jgi:hypothetical protein
VDSQKSFHTISADDVDVGVAMQPEVWLKMRDAHALAAIVHAPVAAAGGDANPVDLDHQVGAGPAAFNSPDRRRAFSRWDERMHPAVAHPVGQRLAGEQQVGRVVVDLANALVRLVDERQRIVVRAARQHLHALQMTGGVEQRGLVAQLAHPKLDLALRAQFAAGTEAHLERVQGRLAIAVRPPQARMLDAQPGKLRGGQAHHCFARRKPHMLGHLHPVEAGSQVAFQGAAGGVGQRRFDFNVRLAAVGFG